MRGLSYRLEHFFHPEREGISLRILDGLVRAEGVTTVPSSRITRRSGHIRKSSFLCRNPLRATATGLRPLSSQELNILPLASHGEEPASQTQVGS